MVSISAEQIKSEIESLINRLGLNPAQELKWEMIKDYLIKARELL
jgi:hypothetical protein